MAIILYGNGLIEDISPKNKVFTDNELTNIYKDFKYIKTKRLDEVSNTWCVWGVEDNINSYNNLGSIAISDDAFSPILFIHDTEVDPDWGLIERPILKNYEFFKSDLLKYIDDVAKDILSTYKDVDEINDDNVNKFMGLDTIGSTNDKRVLFAFDTKKQRKEFYNDSIFSKFSTNVYNYLIDNSSIDSPNFVIYSDPKIIIIIQEENVKDFFDRMIKYFTLKEEYEKCDVLNKTFLQWKNKWLTNKPNKSSKRGRKKNINNSDSSLNK